MPHATKPPRSSTSITGDTIDLEALEAAVQHATKKTGQAPAHHPADHDIMADLDDCAPRVTLQFYISHLNRLASQYLEKHTFQEGQLICWKEELRTTCDPLPAEYPLVVIKILKQDTYEIRDNRVRKPLTITNLVAAWIDNNGLFQCGIFDANRFQPYPPGK